jgi:hypothetical protein
LVGSPPDAILALPDLPGELFQSAPEVYFGVMLPGLNALLKCAAEDTVASVAAIGAVRQISEERLDFGR